MAGFSKPSVEKTTFILTLGEVKYCLKAKNNFKWLRTKLINYICLKFKYQ